MVNMGETLWAWVTEYADGSIGAVGLIVNGRHTPMIGRSEEAIKAMTPYAIAHGEATGQKVWLRKYQMVEDIGRDK